MCAMKKWRKGVFAVMHFYGHKNHIDAFLAVLTIEVHDAHDGNVTAGKNKSFVFAPNRWQFVSPNTFLFVSV